MKRITRFVMLALLAPSLVFSFLHNTPTRRSSSPSYRPTTALNSDEQTVSLEMKLNDERARALFAWVSRAFAGVPQYNDLFLAIVAIFGNMSEDSKPIKMAKEALNHLPDDEEETVGEAISLERREMSSLGAMGAAQWTGQYRTRPHSLLELSNFTSVEDWIKTLPRGCKRTLKKANAQNFTVTTKPIRGNHPAPHSSLAHFKCVLEHEIRLIAGLSPQGFFDALEIAVSRYVGTTRQSGEIQEYRNEDGTVIAFAHEIHKGKTIRGQWFYATDEASRNYVWFHSVQELVRRGIEADDVTVVDLGPSGSDAFTDLKERYGFVSVDDWTSVADYFGPFVYSIEQDDDGMGDKLKAMEGVARLGLRRFF
jgi:hypothetical protein